MALLMYLLCTLHPHKVEKLLGVRRLSSRLPPSIWLCRGRRSKCLLQGNPPSPSQKGDLLVIHIRTAISHRISPRCLRWVFGGCIQLSECNLPAEFLHKLSQLIVHKSPGFSQKCCGVLPPGWGLLGDKWGSSSPSEGGGWVPDGSPVTAAI